MLDYQICFTINQYRNDQDFDDYYNLIKQGYFQAIEIFYPDPTKPDLFKKYQDNVLKLKPMVNQIVLHLPHGPKNDLTNLQNYQLTLTKLLDAISFGNQLGVKKYTLHLGYCLDQDRDDTIKHLINVLPILCQKASPGIIMIENMPSELELGYSPMEIKTIIDAVKQTNLKFILDTGHAHLSHYPLSLYLDLLGDDLEHIHLSDNDQSRDQHQRLGTGTINFNDFFINLKKINYQHLLCLEILFKTKDDLLNNYYDLIKILDQC